MEKISECTNESANDPAKSDPANFTISIVIPVYNSEGILPQLVERLGKVLPSISSEFEVILVNDGSRDESWSEILKLSQHYAWIKGYSLLRNYGQHNAILCGMRLAQFGVIVTMDDDLQHPPSEISKLLEKLREGYDVVYGSPAKESHGLFRSLASQITKIALQKGMGAETARRISAFRAVRSYLLPGFADYSGSFVSIDVLLTWSTTKFSWISTKHDPRILGESNYSLSKLTIHALNMVTGFTTLPLQIASFVGFGFTILGILMMFFVVGRFLIQGSPVPGFTFLAAMISVFSGAQMFSIGIIGEYIARIHSLAMNRPSYRVVAKTNKE